MITKKVRRKKLKGEKFVVFAIIVLAIAIPLFCVFTQAKLSESNIALEKLKQDIEYQTGINESLNMKINELASLDKIREVATSQGLSYNNDNIKVIDN